MNGRRMARAGALVVLPFLCAFGAAAAASRILIDDKKVEAKPFVPTDEMYRIATTTIHGELSDSAVTALGEVPGWAAAALVVVRGPDCLKCEDLGRQLRELSGPEGLDRRVVFMTEPASVESVRGFVRRERLRATVVALAPEQVVAEYRNLPTPAVLVTAADRRTVVGIGHPRRFPNARLRSFSEEVRALTR